MHFHFTPRWTRAFLPLILAFLFLSMYGMPDASLAGICKELLAGTTEGRQALIGSCWHAPLPALLFLPFAWLLPAGAAARAGGFFLWYFYLITLSGMLSGTVAWCVRGKTGDLVKAASTAALLLLCGVIFSVPVAAVLLILPVGALFHAETRRRIPAWILLGWFPALYSIGVWMLMNRLVLGDSFFFARSLSRGTVVRIVRERRTSVRRPSSAGKTLKDVASYVNGRTEYGRVFALGYPGLALLEKNKDELFLPNLDLHIGSLRRAYKGQNLYLLVPRPEGVVRAESVFWRFPTLHTHGAERLLYAGDFGDWRLFEVIQAPTKEQLKEWKKQKETL